MNYIDLIVIYLSTIVLLRIYVEGLYLRTLNVWSDGTSSMA